MNTLALLHVHVACVIISVGLFVLRGVLQCAGCDWRCRKSLRILPHVVDTVLLASAAGLAVMLHQYPFAQAWLTAKLVALVVYVLLGRQALRRAVSRIRNALFLSAALLVVTYIVGVAVTRSALWGAG